MAVFRVERTRDYTVMSNHHLKDSKLSLKAKGLLSMMLSLPEDWNYSTRGLAAICKEGVDSIGSTLKELEVCGYITRNRLRGSDGRITDTEYIIYEKPKEKVVNEKKKSDMELPSQVVPDTENPDVEASDMENPSQLSTNELTTNQLNTYESNTHSFLPSEEKEGRKKDIIHLREQLKDQIDYEHIVTAYNYGQVDEFIEIMMEVALSNADTIRIGREAQYPTAFVQQRFQQLDSSHIEKVLEGIKENTTRVWNTKAYIMAALFNAPSSTDNHYTMLVNHDMNEMR